MKLFEQVKNLRNSIRKRVDARLREFEQTGRGSDKELFRELCFCLLTANYSAERAIRIQEEIGNGFLSLGKDELRKRLRELGHRFPNARAGYILEARKRLDSLGNLSEDGKEAREWLVENVKGLGYKESSHFLRNIGYRDVAILDFHILDLMVQEGLLGRPKTLTPKRYLEIEGMLEELSERLGMGLGELDLYLWYLETGQILK